MRTYRLAGCMVAALTLAAVAGCGPKGKPDALANVNLAPTADKAPPAGSKPPTYAPTTDAAEILRRVVRNYRALTSFQGAGEATATVQIAHNPKPVNQTTTVKYRKDPPGVYMQAQDNVTGTLEYYADGGQVVRYEGRPNAFTRRSCPNDLAAICAGVAKETGQVVTPLVFIGADPKSDSPPGLIDPKYVGTDTVNGHKTYVVRAQLSPEYLRTFAAQQLFRGTNAADKLKPQPSEVTLWVDQDDYLVRKSVGRIAWSGQVKNEQTNTLIALDPEFSFAETATEAVPNPSFAPDAFRFNPPAGAKEIPIESSGQLFGQ